MSKYLLPVVLEFEFEKGKTKIQDPNREKNELGFTTLMIHP
jgi:hypothetical protein